MILFDLVGENEADPAYHALATANGTRQYDFLNSIVAAALAVQRPFLSQTILKALNFHAIACLHVSAGEFRPCPVTVGSYRPPEAYRVQALMDDFVNQVNRAWTDDVDAIALAAFVLWRLNWIHPFINGNGRTARAAAYFVLCVRLGGWLPGSPILPQALIARHNDYVAALQAADQGDLQPLVDLISELLQQQIPPPPTP